MKVAYETLSEAINALKQEGFTYDYNLQDKGILNSQKRVIFQHLILPWYVCIDLKVILILMIMLYYML